ncbi:hypothetical protein H0W80_01060 [Candidatus Saccharibacteria bacterium]|nr:hypothetical protein [Candidatus Saccharibacteria bacterium]
MSNQTNTNLIEKTADTLDLAGEHAEYWTNTTIGKVIDNLMAQVIKHIDNNDLETLQMHSLPALENKLIESAQVMAGESQ